MDRKKKITLDRLNKKTVDKLVEGLEKEKKGYPGTCSFEALDPYTFFEK